jgi:hypothetical protein
MEAHRVDPRDQEWEVTSPRYRVYYWTPLSDEGAWASDEWELDCENVSQAVSWAEHDGEERRFVLYAVVPEERGRVGLVKLYGTDPTQGEAGPIASRKLGIWSDPPLPSPVVEQHRVDPRDVAWEVKSPRYRVCYWRPPRDGGWEPEEWELDSRNILQAMLWGLHDAQALAMPYLYDRLFTLYAVIPAEDGRVGLVKLYGTDPNQT